MFRPPSACNVQFLITNVMHDGITGKPAETTTDTHSIVAAGELGCWIDVPATRVTQAGVEHILCPPTCDAPQSGWSSLY